MKRLFAITAAVLVAGCSTSFAPEPEIDPTVAAIDVAEDDPNREAYYLRDVHDWLDEFDIAVNEEGLDENLLDLGGYVCEAMEIGMEPDEIALVLEDIGGNSMFAIGIVGASSVWLCPEQVGS